MDEAWSKQCYPQYRTGLGFSAWVFVDSMVPGIKGLWYGMVNQTQDQTDQLSGDEMMTIINDLNKSLLGKSTTNQVTSRSVGAFFMDHWQVLLCAVVIFNLILVMYLRVQHTSALLESHLNFLDTHKSSKRLKNKCITLDNRTTLKNQLEKEKQMKRAKNPLK